MLFYPSENSSTIKNLMTKASLPQIQEYHHTGSGSDDKAFLELTYRAEGFIPTPINEMLPIHF